MSWVVYAVVGGCTALAATVGFLTGYAKGVRDEAVWWSVTTSRQDKGREYSRREAGD